MSADKKYSCPAEFWAELGMYIGVIITTCSLSHHMYLLSVVHSALVALMSYLLSIENQSNQEGRAQLILIWMVLVEVNRIGYNRIKSWELEKSLTRLSRLLLVGYYVYYTSTPIQGIRVSLFVLGSYFFFYEIMKGKAFNKCKKSYLMGKNPTLINNYVKRKMLQGKHQTTPMDRCDYIVMGEQNCEIKDWSHGYYLGKKKSDSEGILTIGKVWQRNLPKADTCISLSLAKMLMRRFAKIPAEEAGSKKALNFVLDALIREIGGYGDTQTDRNKGKDNKMERVFRIIDEELTIVDDFLKVKIPTYYYFRWYAIIVVIGILLVLADGIYLIVTITRSYAWLSLRGLEKYKQCFLHHSIPWLDKTITICLVVVCIISLFMELEAIFSPYLDKLNRFSYLKSLRNVNPANWNRPSEKELPQAHGKNAKKDRKYSSVLDPSILPESIKRKFPKPFLRAFVSADAKEAILTFLAENCGQLTNGETSIKKYGMERLNWACQPNISNTEAILVWHIATTLLQQNNDPNQEPAPQQNNNPFTKEVALSLSSYCQYLVSNLPELLPEDVKWTKKMYGNVTKDILSIPWFSDRCKYVLDATWHESSVVRNGVKLAKELMNCAKEGTEVWTMLARFWAEMMLFIAPSDNVEGHAKYLHLNQKELITQLWTLLNHAGIINRPKPTEHQGDESDSNADSKERYSGTMEQSESESNEDTEEMFHGIIAYRNPSAV